MEFISLAFLARLGLGLVASATLAMLVLHAIENRMRTRPESLTSRKRFALGAFHVHSFPRVKHDEAIRHVEEPTQRAA